MILQRNGLARGESDPSEGDGRRTERDPRN